MKRLHLKALAWCALFALISLWVTRPNLSPTAHAQNPAPGYGVNVASTYGMRKTAEMGFRWVRVYYPAQVNDAEPYGLKVLLLLGWEQPLTDVQNFGDSVYSIVSQYRGRIAAYQICNEPNLAEMWHKPKYADPAEYVAYLREAYVRAKQADPNCIIVSAGLALNGGAGDLAMDDVEYIRGMYAAGAKPYFDVLGCHPYGFAYEPEDATSNPIHCFRRAEQEHAVMAEYDDGAKPVWATEFGWIIDPGLVCRDYDGWPGRWWQRVSPQVQADYLLRAFSYARTHWPWMGVMFVWNLDYDLVPWNSYCDQKSWFAILNHDGSARPAYSTLARMAGVPPTPTPTNTATSVPIPTQTSLPTSTPTHTLVPTPAYTPTPMGTPVPGTGILVGRVLLQGRSRHAGSVISMGGHSGTTQDDGGFRVQNIPPGLHDLSVQMPGYIQYRQSGLTLEPDQTLTLPEIALHAGDINGDGVVDLFDLVSISTRYGAQVPAGTPEDVNGDGQVTLLDLVLVSSNYGANH